MKPSASQAGDGSRLSQQEQSERCNRQSRDCVQPALLSRGWSADLCARKISHRADCRPPRTSSGKTLNNLYGPDARIRDFLIRLADLVTESALEALVHYPRTAGLQEKGREVYQFAVRHVDAAARPRFEHPRRNVESLRELEMSN